MRPSTCARIDAIERRDQARRHRLPHPSRRDRRSRGALRSSGHDVIGRARHLPQRPTDARRRHPPCRYRPGARGAEEARLRTQNDADHRPLAWHPCRAGHLRPQARLCLCRIFSRESERSAASRARTVATCAISGAVGTFAQIDPRVEEHVAKAMGLSAGADLDAGHSARPPRDVFRHARRDRLFGRASRRRDSPFAAHRSAGSRRILLGGPEGLVGDAA